MEYWGRKDKLKEAHMQINISLPRPINSDMTTAGTKSFLKQLELAVHHAQKSLKEMEDMMREKGELRDIAVIYRLANVADTGTGTVFKSEHPGTDDIEIELYEA